MNKRIAVITTHPIQYNAPFFKLLAENKIFTVKVFYTWGQAKGKIFDPGFGREREWDIPLLNGYDYEFIENTALKPGSHHFHGIINPGLINKIETFAPGLILVYGWSFKSHLKVLKYFHGRHTIVFRGDSTLLDEKPAFSLRKIARQIFLRKLYKKVDYALYTGVANKNYFLKYGLNEKQLIFAPHAVNNNLFYDVSGIYTAQAMEWRKELGISENELVFLFAGKLEPKKDPEILLNAFLQLPGNDCKLIIVGNGTLEERLKQKAGDNKRVIFLPFQNQSKMPVVYRIGNIFVLPSKGPGETWGLAVNEAMACGLAVLASNKCGCAQDLVQDNKNGFIFKAGNLDDIKGKLLFFKSAPHQAIRFGHESSNIIRDWTYEKIINAVQSVALKSNEL